jgi:hypothetical protein
MKQEIKLLILLALGSVFSLFSQNNFVNGENPSTFRYIHLGDTNSEYIQYIYQVEGFDGINYYGSRLIDENKDGRIDIVMRAKEHLEGEWDIPSTSPRRFANLNIEKNFIGKFELNDPYIFDGDKYKYHSDENGDYYLNFYWADPVKINQFGVEDYQRFLSTIGYELLQDYAENSGGEFIEFSPRVYKMKNGEIIDTSNSSLQYSDRIKSSTALFPWDQMISQGDFDGDGDTDFLMYAWTNVTDDPNLTLIENNNSRGYFYFFENIGQGILNVNLLELNGFNDVTWSIQEGTYSSSIDINLDGVEESLTEITWWTDDNPPSTGNVGVNRSFGYLQVDKENLEINYTKILDHEEYLYSPNWNIGPRFMEIVNFDQLDGDFLLIFNTSQAGSPPVRIDGNPTDFTKGEIQQSLRVFKIDYSNVTLSEVTSSVFIDEEDKTLSLDNSGRPYLIDIDGDGDDDLYLQLGQYPNTYTGGKSQFEKYPSWSGKVNTIYYFENTGSGYKLKDLATINKLFPTNFNYEVDGLISDDNGFYISSNGRQYGIENFIYLNNFSLNDINEDGEMELITATNPDYISVFKKKDANYFNPFEKIIVKGQYFKKVHGGNEALEYDHEANSFYIEKDKIYNKIDSRYELLLAINDPDSRITKDPYSTQKFITVNNEGEKDFYFSWPMYRSTDSIIDSDEIILGRYQTFTDEDFEVGLEYDIDLNIPTADGILITNHSFELTKSNNPPLPFKVFEIDTLSSSPLRIEYKFLTSSDINQNYHQGSGNYTVTFNSQEYSNTQIPGPHYIYEVYNNGELVKREENVNYTISKNNNGFHFIEDFIVETEENYSESLTINVFALDTENPELYTLMDVSNFEDSDNDGILDLDDQCPNTPEGVIVDTNGCEVFSLPEDVFSVNVVSSTCIGSDNGSINLSTSNSSFNYLYSVNGGDPLPFQNDVTISGLETGSYQVCFTVEGVSNYNRCYTVKVGEPDPLEASSIVGMDNRTINLNLSGSKSYNILLNGKSISTDKSIISLPLQSGKNTIEVKGDQECQGLYFEEIFVSEEVKVYPNPTNGPLQLYVSGLDNQVTVDVTSINGTKVMSSMQSVPMNRVIELNLSDLNPGMYIVSVKGTTVQVHQKVIRK